MIFLFEIIESMLYQAINMTYLNAQCSLERELRPRYAAYQLVSARKCACINACGSVTEVNINCRDRPARAKLQAAVKRAKMMICKSCISGIHLLPLLDV